MVFFFKITHGLVKVSDAAEPVPRHSRPIRYSYSNVVKYKVPKCKTVTYQKPFVVRIWNCLSDKLNLTMDNLSSFQIYFSTLIHYDCNHPRTFKTICQKCKTARSLCHPKEAGSQRLSCKHGVYFLALLILLL